MSNSPSVELITNATVAQYIHEISVRHRPRGPEVRPWLVPPPTDEAETDRRFEGRLEAGLDGPFEAEPAAA